MEILDQSSYAPASLALPSYVYPACPVMRRPGELINMRLPTFKFVILL